MQLGHAARGVTFGIVLAATAASAKPPAASGGIAFPKGTQLQAGYSESDYVKFKPEEQVAYLLMWSIHSLEKRCDRELHRYCKLDELVRGLPGENKRIIGLKVDPARDSNYRYAVEITSEGYKTSVEPKRAGIGGFVDDQLPMGGIYFNPDGVATRQSKELTANGWGVGPHAEGGDYQR